MQQRLKGARPPFATAYSPFTRSGVWIHATQAGLLASGHVWPHLPTSSSGFGRCNSGYSGGTARDSHPIPYSPLGVKGHLTAFGCMAIIAQAFWMTRPIKRLIKVGREKDLFPARDHPSFSLKWDLVKELRTGGFHLGSYHGCRLGARLFGYFHQ